jgi:RNA polymerase sigma-70 factor (ECF subfamily)
MQELVDLYHGALYRFALGLSGSEHSAADLTQETYFLWATKGHQLRDVTRVRAWLFTTLHREFLAQNRRERRFPQEDLDSAEGSLPVVEPAMVDAMDCAVVMESLNRVELNYRAPLLLFYLEDMAYRDIAVALELPIGTVMSRISRGKAQLRVLLRDAVQRDDSQVIPMPQVKPNRSQMS